VGYVWIESQCFSSLAAGTSSRRAAHARTWRAGSARSLLNVVGLPEPINYGMDEYEALALKLATTPGVLAEFRTRLARNRTTYPLFDTDRFRRHIEAAYITMRERYQRGEPPESFAVHPIRRVIQ